MVPRVRLLRRPKDEADGTLGAGGFGVVSEGRWHVDSSLLGKTSHDAGASCGPHVRLDPTGDPADERLAIKIPNLCGEKKSRSAYRVQTLQQEAMLHQFVTGRVIAPCNELMQQGVMCSAKGRGAPDEEVSGDVVQSKEGELRGSCSNVDYLPDEESTKTPTSDRPVSENDPVIPRAAPVHRIEGNMHIVKLRAEKVRVVYDPRSFLEKSQDDPSVRGGGPKSADDDDPIGVAIATGAAFAMELCDSGNSIFNPPFTAAEGFCPGRLFGPGKTLHELLAALEKEEIPELSVEEIAEYARQLLVAVRFLHGLGLVHRDLKPSNVFLDSSCQDGRGSAVDVDSGCRKLPILKISDFGLSVLITTRDTSIDKPSVEEVLTVPAPVAPLLQR